MPDRPLRIILWCAVSSRKQAEPDKVSLSEQEQAGRRFAAGIGGQVVDVLTDPGESRSLILWQDAEREIDAYRRLREHCERADFDVLHTLTSDRLGRTQALMAQAYALTEQAGAEVYDASAPHTIGSATIANRYVAAIQAVNAEREIVELKRRYRVGMRGRVRRGLHPNTWPYGYAPVRDAHGEVVGAELLPEQAAVVAHITERFLAGTTFVGIARELNDAGMMPGHGRWWPRAVHRICDNDTYAGYPAWGDVQPQQPSTHYPALWDADTYAAVVAERHARGNRTQQNSHLLDVAFCQRCGGRMVAQSSTNNDGRRYEYLRCGRHSRYRDCHANRIREAVVRDAVAAFVADALPDADAIHALAHSRVSPRDALLQQLAELDSRLAEVNGQRQRLAYALAAGQMDATMYRATDDGLLAEVDAVRATRRSIEMRVERTPTPAQQVATLERLAGMLDELWEMTPREASALLQAAGVRAFVEEGIVVRVEFEC